MNLGQLRTAIQRRGYETDTVTSQTEAINSVYREIVGDHRWKWLEAQSAAVPTVAGTAGYALTAFGTDVVHPLRVHFGSTAIGFEDLSYIPPEEMQRLQFQDRAGDSRGVPTNWTYQNSQIILWPEPDSASYSIFLDYVKDPPDLSADGDTPLLPATYHDLLVVGAIAEIATRQRDWATHDRYRTRFQIGLRRMKAQEGLGQQGQSLQIPRSGFFDSAVYPPLH